MAVPYTDHEYVPVFNDTIHDKVSFERMNPDRRRNLMAFARHSWIGSDEVQQGKKLIVISFGNQCSEIANAFFCNGNNILFRLDEC